jgi:hypothetical protein
LNDPQYELSLGARPLESAAAANGSTFRMSFSGKPKPAEFTTH